MDDDCSFLWTVEGEVIFIYTEEKSSWRRNSQSRELMSTRWLFRYFLRCFVTIRNYICIFDGITYNLEHYYFEIS